MVLNAEHAPEWPAYEWTDWIDGQSPVFAEGTETYDDDAIVGYRPLKVKRVVTHAKGQYWGDCVTVTLEDVQRYHPKELEAIIKTQEEVAILSLKDAIERA